MKATLAFVVFITYFTATCTALNEEQSIDSISNQELEIQEAIIPLRFLDTYPHSMNLNKTEWGYLLDF